jgi:hypothetical protein
MEMRKARAGRSSGHAVKADVPVKHWAVMTWAEQWTYTWHVVVMVATFGFVFPNAMTS